MQVKLQTPLKNDLPPHLLTRRFFAILQCYLNIEHNNINNI